MAVQLDSDAIVDPAQSNGIFPPVSDGLIAFYEHIGNVSPDRARLNLVTGQLGSIVGTPVYEADGTIFGGGNNWLDTLIAETDASTWFVVSNILDAVAATTAGRAALFGNYSSSGNGGICLQMDPHSTLASPAGGLKGTGKYAGSFVVSTKEQTSVLGWRMRSHRVAPASGVTVTDQTTGETNTVAYNDTRVLYSAVTLRVGCHANVSYRARVKALFTVGYNRRLSDAEMALMKAFLAGMALDVSSGIVV